MSAADDDDRTELNAAARAFRRWLAATSRSAGLVARTAGVNPSTLRAFATGRRGLRAELRRRIADAHGARVQDIFGEPDAPANGDLRRLRLAAGLTQTELGERIGVSLATVSRWERDGALAPEGLQPEADAGEGGPDAETYRRRALALIRQAADLDDAAAAGLIETAAAWLMLAETLQLRAAGSAAAE